MSSRNVFLDARERAVAPQLYSVLKDMSADLGVGRPRSETLRQGRLRLENVGFRIDYLELRDAETLLPVEEEALGPARLLTAAWLGTTRLIDNVSVKRVS
jgi:pantoate--beta-alanine ligase